MLFYSTREKSPPATFREAVWRGMPEDGGLYMPAELKALPVSFFQRLKSFTFLEIAYEIARIFVEDEIPPPELRKIVEDAFDFSPRLIPLEERLYVLELFHGPTLAFKDFGARFLARIMAYWKRRSGKRVVILVATSGDTGSAVANGFLNLKGFRVVLLYPSGKVSEIQEKQLTTLGGNISALEVQGNFDDCQRLVKQAFMDADLQSKLTLTSANSINIGRWIPQSFYYFSAFAQLPNRKLPLIFSVPSGNYGNLTGGLMAKKMGLYGSTFVAASNSNDVVPEFLRTGNFQPRKPVMTLSNAMDVGDPSNFERLAALYDHDLQKIRADVTGIPISDEETREGIREVFENYGYLLDPHSAVAYRALRQFIKHKPANINAIFLATAHPAKFASVVEEVTGQKVPLPEGLQKPVRRRKEAISMTSNFLELKSFLLAL
jgi:threonine synthase